MQRQFHVHECGAVNGGMSATSKAPSPPTQVAAAAFVEDLALGTLASSGGGVDVVLNSLTSPGEGRQFLLL